MSLSRWGRENLRRKWSELNSYRRRSRQNEQSDDRTPVNKPEKQPLTDNDGQNQRNEGSPGKDTPSNKIIAAFTAFLFIASLFQWQRMGDQIASSEKIADTNSRETRDAIKVSQSLARSAAQQVIALKDLAAAGRIEAGAADRSAGAVIAQATTTREQLAVNQAPKVDVFMTIKAYQRGIPVEVAGRIANQGVSTMRAGSDFNHIWNVHRIGPRSIDVVPGISRDQIMRFEDLTDEQWAAISSHQIYLVFATRFIFKDASGVRRPPIESCITLTGPPEDMRRESCNY